MSENLRKVGLEIRRHTIAEGGTSKIHHAHVVSSDSPYGPPGTEVAVKQYKAATLEIPQQLDRIRQEAELTAKVTHENIVRSYGLVPGSDDGEAFHILEWVDGQTLKQWIATLPQEAKAWERLQAVALGVVEGIDALHSQKIMHRDLKSENILMHGDTPKITDLGIAEAAADDSATMHTQLKDFIGSIRFASPQFVRGEKYSAEDDVYGFGTVLFELCTGRPVYEDVARKTLLPQRILEAPPTIPPLLPTIPPPIRTVIEGCLHPERARRPTLSELREAVRTPESSAYAQRERDAQSNAERGYPVIHADSDGTQVWVDVGGHYGNLEDKVTRVVRLDGSITVPRTGGTIVRERWIADVQIKHVYGTTAHCIRVERRWHERGNNAHRVLGGSLSAFASVMGRDGEWMSGDARPSKIRVGDRLILD